MVKSLVWQVQYVDLYTLQIYTSVDICGCGWCDEGPADMRAGAADSVHEHLQSQVLCAAASPTAMPRPSRTGRQPGQEDPWSMQSSRSHWPAWSRQNVLPLRRRACLLSANETLEHYHPRSTIAIFELIRPFDHTMMPWKFCNKFLSLTVRDWKQYYPSCRQKVGRLPENLVLSKFWVMELALVSSNWTWMH